MPEPAEQATSGADAAVRTEEPSRKTRARAGGVVGFVRENPRLVASGALFVAGIVIVMLGWYGTAKTNILSQQIPFIVSGGLLGLGLIIVGGFFAASQLSEQRTEQLRRDLMNAMQSLPLAEGTPGSNGGRARAQSGGTVFALAAGHSYHLAGCPIIEGKPTRETTARAAISSGLAMCKLCGPE